MRWISTGLMSLFLLTGLLSCPASDDDDVADDDAGDDDVGDDDVGDDDVGDDDTADDDTADDDVGDDDVGDDDVGDDDTSDDDSGDDDTVFVCGTIGQACTIPSQCDPGQDCYLGGNGGVCGINRPGCGGFVGAICKDPGALNCMYLESSDYGLCASDDEKDCICNTTPLAMETGVC